MPGLLQYLVYYLTLHLAKILLNQRVLSLRTKHLDSEIYKKSVTNIYLR